MKCEDGDLDILRKSRYMSPAYQAGPQLASRCLRTVQANRRFREAWRVAWIHVPQQSETRHTRVWILATNLAPFEGYQIKGFNLVFTSVDSNIKRRRNHRRCLRRPIPDGPPGSSMQIPASNSTRPFACLLLALLDHEPSFAEVLAILL